LLAMSDPIQKVSRKAHLVLLTREVVGSLDVASHAVIEVCPARVVGLVYREGKPGLIFELEVKLAVLPRFHNVGFGTNLCGKLSVEVCEHKISE
jgi:hypothetical protein